MAFAISVGSLWLSCAPYSLVARVTAVRAAREVVHFEYELLGEDGSLLDGPIESVLDDSWWETFQPLSQARV